MRRTSLDSGERRLGRRAVLRAAALTGLAAAAGEWAARRWPHEPPVDAEAPRRLAAVGEVAVGEAKPLARAASGRQILLVRLDAATFVAVDRRCPHLGCPVLWSVTRGRFECPCHAAVFDARTGRVEQGPPRRGLDRLPIEVRGDEVWLVARGGEDEP